MQGVGFLSNLGSALQTAQNLPVLPKIAITLAIVGLAGVFLYQLWQSPVALPGAAPVAAESRVLAPSPPPPPPPAAEPATQGPPVTVQQKQEALASLQAALDDLAAFPSKPGAPEPPSILQKLVVNKLSYRLYMCLGAYYKPTITEIPAIGADLYDFKLKYYGFENAELDFESSALAKIAAQQPGVGRLGWQTALGYFLIRSSGISRDQIVRAGGAMEGMSFDAAENIYAALGKDEAVAKTTAAQLALHAELARTARKLVQGTRQP